MCATILAIAAFGCSPSPPQNVVLIVVDTLRRDHLSPYGADLETPHIQALADRGQVFSGLLASFHQTTMSMGALFSGRTPSIEAREAGKTLRFTGRTWCGLSRFFRDEAALERATGECIPPGVDTLPQRLQRGGWYTIGVVSNRLLFAPAGFERGFDDWREVAARRNAPKQSAAMRLALRSAPHVLTAVRDALARAPREHVFLYVHYIDVHDWGVAGRTYAQAVEAFDVALGRLLDTLEAERLLDDAVVLLTSDHGEALGERHPIPARPSHLGNPSYQTVLEVPLIISPPIDMDPSRVLRSQDLAGLILGIAGLPEEMRSNDSVLLPDELLLTERHFLTYQRGRWKTILHRQDPSRSGLFDLIVDPGETVNQIDARPEVVRRHRNRIMQLRSSLVAAPVAGDDVTDTDRERLHALGYAE